MFYWLFHIIDRKSIGHLGPFETTSFSLLLPGSLADLLPLLMVLLGNCYLPVHKEQFVHAKLFAAHLAAERIEFRVPRTAHVPKVEMFCTATGLVVTISYL